MNNQKLEQFLQDNNLPKFRLGQIQKAIFQDGATSFGEITTLSKDLREKMEKEMRILSFEVEKVLVAGPARNATRIALQAGRARTSPPKAYALGRIDDLIPSKARRRPR